MQDNTVDLQAALQQVGWSPNRRVDDAQVEEWLRIGVNDFGCHIFPEAVRVLREFGGLTFSGLHCSPEDSFMRGDKLDWHVWEWYVQEILFPVAYSLQDTFTFAVSSTKKVYGLGTGYIYCGDTFEEFVANRMLFIRGREYIPMHWTETQGREVEALYKAIYTQQP